MLRIRKHNFCLMRYMRLATARARLDQRALRFDTGCVVAVVFPSMSDAFELVFEDRDRMSLVGLMLGEVVARNLNRPAGAALARRLRGSLGIVAGKMAITMRFDGQRVVLARGLDPKLRARIKGTLDGLLQVSVGRGAVRSFLAGEISIKGNFLFALKLLPLMRAYPQAKGSRR